MVDTMSTIVIPVARLRSRIDTSFLPYHRSSNRECLSGCNKQAKASSKHLAEFCC